MQVVYIVFHLMLERLLLMPRSLSAGLQTQVSSTATKTAFLVELNLSSTLAY